MATETAATLEFQDAVRGLLNGDFSRLEPLFVHEPPAQPSPIITWHRGGLFADEPPALAEALACACFNDRVEVAEYLLGVGVDPAMGNATGMNAFHWAANRGQLNAVQLLIAHRAPLETLNMYGGTVLGCTVWSAIHEPRGRQVAVVAALLEAGAATAAVQFPCGHAAIDALLSEQAQQRNS